MAKSSAAPATKFEKLKKLAESATQGDWIVREYTGGHIGVDVKNARPKWKTDIFHPRVDSEGYGGGGASREDADFIAAANPTAILEILAAHQALYEALSALVSLCECNVLSPYPHSWDEITDKPLAKARAALALADAAQEGEANGG